MCAGVEQSEEGTGSSGAGVKAPVPTNSQNSSAISAAPDLNFLRQHFTVYPGWYGIHHGDQTVLDTDLQTLKCWDDRCVSPDF